MKSVPDFIDRKSEIRIFENILNGKQPYCAIAFLNKPRNGKTYLIRYLHAYSQQHELPAAMVDFDNRQGEVISYWKFIYRICDSLGWENFPEVVECEKRHKTSVPLIQFHAASGYGGIKIGEETQFEESHLEKISGRDQLEITTGDIIYIGDKSEIQQEKMMYEMGRAFQTGIKRIGTKKRLTLFLDTFECATIETIGWLESWLFECVPDLYPNLIIIIAGRPELHSYLNDNKPWKVHLHIREIFEPPGEDDIREYFNKFSLNIPDFLIPYLVKYAHYKISMLPDIVKSHLSSKND